jgi:hypothetical protein
MTYDFKPEPEFADELAARIIEDADKLRTFCPDCSARIKFAWAGRTFEIVLSMEEEKPSDAA